MKKELTKAYISSERGCYSKEQVEALSFIKKKEEPTIIDVVESEIPLKDKFWFVINKCELTERQKQDIAIACAEIVLEIYESKYPNDKAPREAIQAAKDFLAGKITIDILRSKRNAVVYAANAAAYAADAAYAANVAAAYAADAADAANVAAAAAAAYAANVAAANTAYAANAAALKAISKTTLKKDFAKLLLNFLLDFINKN